MAGVVGADADVVGGAGLLCWSCCCCWDLSWSTEYGCCCCCCCWCCSCALRIGDDGGGVEGLEEACWMRAPSSAVFSFGGCWSRLVIVQPMSDCSGGNASVRAYSTLGTFAASRCPGDSLSLLGAPRPLLSPPSRLNAVANLANMLSKLLFGGASRWPDLVVDPTRGCRCAKAIANRYKTGTGSDRQAGGANHCHCHAVGTVQ